MSEQRRQPFGAVAIGRNEGDRLRRCLSSLSSAAQIVYVDSGSTDASLKWAQEADADIVNLDMRLPFTAARARNAGFRRLRETNPQLRYIQFIDGDCELRDAWPSEAISFLETHADVGAVTGRRRERFPDRSVYNWLCDWEWNGPVGEVQACGGDVMMRTIALESVVGYRDDLIAGEEPELCVRLRAAQWRVWRLEIEMTWHDAAMMRFGQWWTRTLRGGYAFAEGAYLHGKTAERHWVWESRRAWLWGIWWPVFCLTAAFTCGVWGCLAALAYPLQVLRQTVRNGGSLRNRIVLAFFQVLARFPEGLGQILFTRDRLLSRKARLIEYK